MDTGHPPAAVDFTWSPGPLTLRFAAGAGPLRLVDITAPDIARSSPSMLPEQPLVEILSPRYGRHGNSTRVDGSVIGSRLRYLDHIAETDGSVERLTISQHDATTGVRVATLLEVTDRSPAVRITSVVDLVDGARPLPIWLITSLATGAVISDEPDDLEVWMAATSWSAENRWDRHPLRARELGGIRPGARGETTAGRLSWSSDSTWSSGTTNPAGAIRLRSSGITLAWQIEHNGGWHVEVGERPGTDRLDGAYVAITGPNDQDHHWSFHLTPDRTITTVPVTFTVAPDLDRALGHLARHRRRTRRQHPQNTTLPVIFNDYMNTLMGDPSEARLLPLIDAAAAVGAEYFCIDAGWYDDTAGWWASVGDWRPSTTRFPSGFLHTLDHIRSVGLVPGLWMEPEVIGVSSHAAARLPDDAFLRRAGERIRERDRYFLDLRSAAARAHLDESVDRLVNELGVGYFKLDYNITPGAGPDTAADSVGQALLEHNRALLAWLTGLLDRHPGLVLESCSSGAMRSDSATLQVMQLQSTSDQTDPLLYPAIAVGALAHILPEQAGNWAYPQPAMSDEEIVFALTVGLVGRLYLSGFLSEMSEHQLALVRGAVQAHRDTRQLLATAIPRFPLGLPSWEDRWVAVAFDAQASHGQTLVAAWHLPGAEPELQVVLPHLRDTQAEVTQLHPSPGVGADWFADYAPGTLTLRAPVGGATARIFRLAAPRGSAAS